MDDRTAARRGHRHGRLEGRPGGRRGRRARPVRPRTRRVDAPPGWVEHDAEAVWWTDFTAVVADLLRAAGGRPLAGLGISGLLPADEHGDPLRPAILYGVDTRAGAEIAELNDEFGAGEILARGGTPLTGQAVGPKVRWPARHEPDVHVHEEAPDGELVPGAPAGTSWTTTRPASARRCTTSRPARGRRTGRSASRPGRRSRTCCGRPRSPARSPPPRLNGPGCRSPPARSTPGRKPRASASASPAT